MPNCLQQLLLWTYCTYKVLYASYFKSSDCWIIELPGKGVSLHPPVGRERAHFRMLQHSAQASGGCRSPQGVRSCKCDRRRSGLTLRRATFSRQVSPKLRVPKAYSKVCFNNNNNNNNNVTFDKWITSHISLVSISGTIFKNCKVRGGYSIYAMH